MTQQQQETIHPGPQVSEHVTGPIQDDPFAGFIDTYSFGGQVVYNLPDGKQSITFKILNEGEKSRYQRLTNRDIKINRKTDEAAFKPDAAADRHALILTAVVDWHLATKDPNSGRWSWMTFNQAMLENWLKVTDPKIVEELEAAIRKANPWLGEEDVTEEDLEEEIRDLQDRLTTLRQRNAGKGL